MEKFSFYEKNSRIIFGLVLSVNFFVNLWLGSTIELSFDESYYWIYSQFLDFGYYDHPPMVAIFIKLGTLLFGTTELGVRFFSNILFSGTILLMWDLVKYHKEQLLFWILVFSMPLLNLSGLVALPDTPLMFFTTLFFWTTKKYIKEDTIKNSLLVALAITLMFYSKYHGLLIVLLTCIAYPHFFKKKSFWLIVLLVTILFLPHIYWQYQNEFISFKFHLTGRREKHFDIANIFDYIGGQIVLMGFLNFFVFLYIFYKNKFKNPFERILLFNSVGFLIFLFFLSFRNQIEANWTISCSIAFVVLMLPYLGKYKKIVLGLSSISLIFFFVLKFAMFNIEKFVSSSDENRLNEIVGWKGKRLNQLDDICEGLKLVGDNYQVTSKVAFYKNDPNIPSLHIGSRFSQYTLLKLHKDLNLDEKFCYFTSKNLPNSMRIETLYKDPVYVVKGISLNELKNMFRKNYEEALGN